MKTPNNKNDDIALMDAIKKANVGWERWEPDYTALESQYDSDADILYTRWGDPEAEAFSLPGAGKDEVYLRIDKHTLRIIGMDILYFRHMFLKNHPEGQKIFDPLFAVLGDGDWKVEVKKDRHSSATSSYFHQNVRTAAPELVH